MSDTPSAICMSPFAAVPNTATRQDNGGLGVLLFFSLLVMLNLPLFFTLNTGMDLYGFYKLGPVADYPLPYSPIDSAEFGFGRCWLRLLPVAVATTGAVHRRTLGPVHQRGYIVRRPSIARLRAKHPPYQPRRNPQPHRSGGAHGRTVVYYTRAQRPGNKTSSQPGCPLVHRHHSYHPGVPRAFYRGHAGALLRRAITGIRQPTVAMGIYLVGPGLSAGCVTATTARRSRRFTLTGSGFMIVALGGSMLGAILGWTRPRKPYEKLTDTAQHHEVYPPWVAAIVQEIESARPTTADEMKYVAVLNGYELYITTGEYERLVADKDILLRGVGLLVDKLSGEVFLNAAGVWTRLDFQIASAAIGVRSGPFMLLCVYARHPGRRRFTTGELRAIAGRGLSNRRSIGIGDFIRQLQRRDPSVPVVREGDRSYIPGSARVCLLDRLSSPPADGDLVS